MPCSAINYNVMVSPDICVQFANPTWPNLRVLIAACMRAASIREKACVRGCREAGRWRVASERRERERGREIGKEKALLSQYLSSAGGQQCERAHATVPLHPLSSNVSFLFPKGTDSQADTERRRDGRDLYKNVKLSRGGRERKKERERKREWECGWAIAGIEERKGVERDIKKEDEAPDNASGDVATKLAYQ